MFKKITGLFNRYQSPEDENRLLQSLDRTRLPHHIAIIMDGNGRWAQRRGMPRSLGHRAGVESLRNIVQLCSELGIQVLTCYAFSTENWKRPVEEVNFLMNLLVEYLHKELDELHGKNVRINAIGRLSELPQGAREALENACRTTAGNSGLILNLALNYGGRKEITDAVIKIAQQVKENKIDVKDIDEKLISEHLYTAGLPDPDLLVRPSGDYRISNFLLWQLAYTEFWLSDVMWPDFRRIHLIQAILAYQSRERRFGGLIKK
ncbi:isoprenyl transferase [Desulforamulus hydrothermalis]|uniref:Isoprenyl transferase n=1 Tax=Desulforamulus hydrothermalis Lam5 = DSM 18033 TaxID=1121428 RepID=K8E1A4_9FIRM|nr:isoprenyl transferase [Desulforamulus hydrothermalis]CCO09440.1 Undecaprenyl pyrophosphate synthase [Desulforamulus hydrothermalis Lam5 = DSM 18033]SHH08102.1 Undecaprenyl pyrophosphate synthetase [Desulforamulus hydrothermalis Lam5 = DSM 18033]